MLKTEAIAIGPEITRLRGGGRVFAPGRNAVYLHSEDGHVASVVGAETPDGPLSLRVPDLRTVLNILDGRQELTFRVASEAIELEEAVRISWARSDRWLPQLPACVATEVQRQQAVAALASLIAKEEPLAGCGPFAGYLPQIMADDLSFGGITAMNAVSGRLATRLGQAIKAIHEGCGTTAAASLINLLGLGPGLTPSGDDLVAGLVATLVWQREAGAVPPLLVNSLAETVQTAAPDRTNAISARLLWYASEGVLYASAMDLGAALLAGDKPAIHIHAKRLFSIGHTTGVDVAVGLMCGTLLGIEVSERTHGRFAVSAARGGWQA